MKKIELIADKQVLVQRINAAKKSKWIAVDTEFLSRSYRVEASRRVGDSWRATLEIQIFSNIDQKDVLAVFENDDLLLVEMAYFF